MLTLHHAGVLSVADKLSRRQATCLCGVRCCVGVPTLVARSRYRVVDYVVEINKQSSNLPIF